MGENGGRVINGRHVERGGSPGSFSWEVIRPPAGRNGSVTHSETLYGPLGKQTRTVEVPSVSTRYSVIATYSEAEQVARFREACGSRCLFPPVSFSPGPDDLEAELVAISESRPAFVAALRARLKLPKAEPNRRPGLFDIGLVHIGRSVQAVLGDLLDGFLVRHENGDLGDLGNVAWASQLVSDDDRWAPVLAPPDRRAAVAIENGSGYVQSAFEACYETTRGREGLRIVTLLQPDRQAHTVVTLRESLTLL